MLGVEDYAVIYPPNGIIPFHGFCMYGEFNSTPFTVYHLDKPDIVTPSSLAEDCLYTPSEYSRQFKRNIESEAWVDHELSLTDLSVLFAI